ncbi:metal ABC transporter solute-binding protein, Zn/Mn family [Falsiroseomonas tokyonensis]|uniref:Metal ABC transporter solute-binding protein, Zn/Mn family n=1 Tax=Falsiroseomonas tokyonensis TaxID=430521 RepID=A0ABV7BLM7_9PROT|nr:zinc ABC transporter substrate-binding protein [Falsiroseomonas tokyonensis]MBU8536481.1 zinc ABC transporter substrate-binding protein [Falsiroseomonas tokyonensis]
MFRRSLLSLPALLLAVPARAQAPATQPLVVASFSILGDMVAQIAGDRVRLRTIAGPNVDAHSFAPRPSDAQALREAALVVRNGLGFDGWMDRMLRAAGYRGAVATATDGITPRQMDGHAHNHDHGGAGRRHSHSVGPRQVPDPHAWQDLRFGIRYARGIATALAAAVPAQAAAIEAGAAAYVARLEALDAWVRAEIAKVPEARRKVVTSHDAFGYFGAAYGVTFLAPQGISTEAEPSAADVARLIRQIRAEGISAVFLENMANPSTLERLAREAGVTVQGRLYADALSEPAGPAPSYEAMFRHNLGLLVPAMRGAA